MEVKAQEVLDVIIQFNIPGWTSVTDDQVTVNRIGQGYVNLTFKVEKLPAHQGKGPNCLIFKKYGGNIYAEQANGIFDINSPLVQSLIFYEQSKRGWGPKLYGLLDDVRVEEFVQGHTLKPDEAFREDMIKDLAKAYARFHSLDLPLKKQSYDLLGRVLPQIGAIKKPLKEFIESGKCTNEDALRCLKLQHDFPFKEEGKWLQSILPKVKRRTVLCTMDPNYLNRLVREEQPTDANCTRALIIDYDITCYASRGFDFGGHFINRMFNVNDKESYVSGLSFPSEEEQKQLLSAYLKESKQLFEDFDESGLDSLDNLMLEVSIDLLVYIVSMSVASSGLFTIMDKEPNIYKLLEPLLVIYKERKKVFCEKYPHLLVD